VTSLDTDVTIAVHEYYYIPKTHSTCAINQETCLPYIKVPTDGHKWKHDVSKLPHKTAYTAEFMSTSKVII